MVLKHENRHHREGLVKHRCLGINSRVSSSGGLRWGSIIYISNKFSGDIDAAAPGTSL